MINALVVEDNDFNLLFLKAYLESFGCHCETAQNGAYSIGILINKEIDIVFMDCQMPVMAGYILKDINPENLNVVLDKAYKEEEFIQEYAFSVGKTIMSDHAKISNIHVHNNFTGRARTIMICNRRLV